MAIFLVRQSCEYSITVEAETAEEAILIADSDENVNKWSESWSESEIDEDSNGE